MKPNPEEIKAEIEKLRDLKPRIRQYSAFGDDNHAAIGAEILVLEGRLFEDCEHNLDAALAARSWLDGYEETPPSEGWESLVQDA